MTERIDLDELAESTDEEETPNPGDWIWRDGEAPPPEDVSDRTADDAAESPLEDDVVPGVPQENPGKPAGIPVEGSSQPGTDRTDGATAGDPDATPGDPEGADRNDSDATTGSRASGPHGGGVDDMTMALTYGAMRSLANPRAVMGDARQWADWIGLVGEVDAHVINKYQRDHGIDVDFFNGSGTGPGERLREIDEHSMFFAERMVVVGRSDDDEWIADRADWEFVPLPEAAAKADWARTEE